jgi:hypothetical protein
MARCLADTHASHRQLRAAVDTIPVVAAVDTVTDSSPVTTELVLAGTDTVPPAVLQRIAGAGLGIADVMQRPESLWVSVR